MASGEELRSAVQPGLHSLMQFDGATYEPDSLPQPQGQPPDPREEDIGGQYRLASYEDEADEDLSVGGLLIAEDDEDESGTEEVEGSVPPTAAFLSYGKVTAGHHPSIRERTGRSDASCKEGGDDDDKESVDEIMRNALFLLALKHPSLKRRDHHSHVCPQLAPRTWASLKPENLGGGGGANDCLRDKGESATKVETEWKGKEDRYEPLLCIPYSKRKHSTALPSDRQLAPEEMQPVMGEGEKQSRHCLPLEGGESASSSDDDEDVDPGEEPPSSGKYQASRKRKRPVERKRATAEQVVVLEKMYREDKFPSSALIRQTGQLLGMKPSKVKNWFQNKRAKERRVSAGKERRSHATTKRPGIAVADNGKKRPRLADRNTSATDRGLLCPLTGEQHARDNSQGTSLSRDPPELLQRETGEQHVRDNSPGTSLLGEKKLALTPVPAKKRLCAEVPLTMKRAALFPSIVRHREEDGHPRFLLPALVVDPSASHPLRMFSPPLPPALPASSHHVKRP